MFSYAYRAVTAVFTVFALLISVGSCTLPSQEDEVVSPIHNLPLGVSSEGVSVHILQAIPEVSQPLLKMADTLSVEGELSVQVQTISSRDDYRSTLRTRLFAGEPADLFHLLDREDVNQLQPYLEDLSSVPYISATYVELLQTAMTDDALYGLPVGMEGIGLIANREIFNAAGIDLAGITGFQSFSDALTELQEKIVGGDLAETYPALTAVTNLPLQDKAYIQGVLSELLLTSAFPTPAEASGSPTLPLDAVDMESYLKLLARVSPNNGNWPDFLKVSQRDVVEKGIAEERYACLLHSTSTYDRVAGESEEVSEKLVLLPVFFENSECGAVYTGTPAWWAINRSASEETKAEAKKILTWLYRTTDGKQLYQEGFTTPSPYLDEPENFYTPLYEGLAALSPAETVHPLLAPESPSSWRNNVLTEEIQSYFGEYSKEWRQVTDSCISGWIEAVQAKQTE